MAFRSFSPSSSVIDFEAPELRHLRAWPECLRIFQPKRDPFLPQLQPDVFQVRSNLLLILQQVARSEGSVVNARRELAVDDSQRFRVRQQASNFSIVGSDWRSRQSSRSALLVSERSDLRVAWTSGAYSVSESASRSNAFMR